MKTYDFEVILAAGTDMSEELADRLFVEGVDAYRRTNGVEVAMPYAAVVEFEGNLIASWRDYIDTRRMESLRAGDAPPDYLCALTN